MSLSRSVEPKYNKALEHYGALSRRDSSPRLYHRTTIWRIMTHCHEKMLPEPHKISPKRTIRNPEEHRYYDWEMRLEGVVSGNIRGVRPACVLRPRGPRIGNSGASTSPVFPKVSSFSSMIHLLFGGRCSAAGAPAPSPRPTAGRRSESAADFVQIRSFPLSSLNCGIACPALPLSTEPTLCHPVWSPLDGVFRRFRAPNPFFSPKGPNHVNIC